MPDATLRGEMNTVRPSAMGAMDAAIPAGYGKNKRIAFCCGFRAASYGTSVNACPTLNADWRRAAWRAGHAAYHTWLQANRVRACDRVEATTTTPEAP